MKNKIDRSSHSANSSIKEHRIANATIRLVDKNQQPLACQEVIISQRNHKFLFGCTGFESIFLPHDMPKSATDMKIEQTNKKLLDMFNFITLPFYWSSFEPKRGQPHTRQLLKTAQWFADRGCLVKGHPLCWHSLSGKWLLEMSNADIIEAQLARIRREVSDFAGLIDMWDVINEVVIMPVFEKQENGITRIARELGRFGIIRKMFDEARSVNPGATLLLNDFDLSPAYEILIEGCLDTGIRIDAIGIQSHMHQGYWGVDRTFKILERYAQFNLPIHFTETTLVSGHLMPHELIDLNDYKVDEWPTTPDGEERQAREVAEFYKNLLSHPAVEAITWWGLSDDGWLKAPSGLLRKDFSIKPAYKALHDLVKGEWWLSPEKMVTDNKGKLRFDGFLGEYTLSWQGEERTFNLDNKGSVAIDIEL